ncbi:STAS domain-containing protein [Streptomyces sp. NRRL B-24085]|uniref:STAS domain-containing protein n=1 Tax=Streptomyces sp. NRRL B-24085 TaxID=1709476 RepID=UPI000A8427B4|nr:STAS domain-containing protein [Streptomyces sp. NRRL B-24085]
MTAEPSVQANASGTSLTVQVGGDMDWQTAPFFRERLLGEITTGQQHVVLELSAVSFCDSAGLNVLLWAWRRAGQAGSMLVLARVQPKVQRTLAMTGADTVLRVYDTVREAENALVADGV